LGIHLPYRRRGGDVLKQRYYLTRLYLGLLLRGAGGLTAWSVSRPAAPVTPEAAPMEAMLEESGPSGVTWDLPVTRNERVDEWIDFLKGRNADRTQLWLERSGRYAPMIQGELRRRGMPEDLLYLALIESGVSPRAGSGAPAGGDGQFSSATGRRHGRPGTPWGDGRREQRMPACAGGG